MKESLINHIVFFKKGVITNCMVTRVKSEPDSHSQYVCSLNPFATVKVFYEECKSDNWYYVETQSCKRGFVEKKYIAIVRDTH